MNEQLNISANSAPAASVNTVGSADTKGAAIEFAQFSFAYPDCSPALVDINARVSVGAFALLGGATGSGKTTLLRCCKPEIAPTGKRSGSINVLNLPLDSWNTADSAAKIGYVDQNPHNQIVCDTVWHELAFGLENLGVAPDTMRRRVAEVAHFFGIEPWVRQPVDELSGGQKQLVNLAAILAMRPQVLLLDEPTVQLDPVAERNFLHELFRVNRELGITVVVATHAPETMVEYATLCLELHAGQLKEVPLEQYKTERGKTPIVKQSSVTLVQHANPVVNLQDVYVRYKRDAHWVLRGCDLTVYEGNVHAVVGGNGCGKSTLLYTVAGVLKPERGRAHNARQKQQALLPQNIMSLFACDTVEEELFEWQKSLGYSGDDVDKMIAQMGLQNFSKHHPFDLSGGQQQELGLAKLLLTKPRLLLLDEPTKGLDARSKCEMARVLLDLAGDGMAIIVATHDLSFVSQVADTITMLFDGEDACTEPTSHFFQDNLFYRPIFDGFMQQWKRLNSNDLSAQEQSC